MLPSIEPVVISITREGRVILLHKGDGRIHVPSLMEVIAKSHLTLGDWRDVGSMWCSLDEIVSW